MKQFMIVDVDRCWGCKSCMVACKKGHGIIPGNLSFVSVFRVENKGKGDSVNCDFIPISCQHCKDAVCMSKCPKKAIYRAEDGTVLINRELCVGCGLCSSVCPYGAISMYKNTGDEKKYPYKCDLCASRRERGAETYCSQHCPGKVFSLVSEDALEVEKGKHSFSYSVGQVVYVSDVIHLNERF